VRSPANLLVLINERTEQWKGGELMAKKPPAPPPEQGFARCPPLLLATKVEQWNVRTSRPPFTPASSISTSHYPALDKTPPPRALRLQLRLRTP
jgi:hypothetical protein